MTISTGHGDCFVANALRKDNGCVIANPSLAFRVTIKWSSFIGQGELGNSLAPALSQDVSGQVLPSFVSSLK